MKYLIALFLMLFLPAIVSASETKQPIRPKIGYQFSYTPLYQFETELDAGGQFDVQRHFFRFDVSRFIDRHWMVGVGLSLDYERWSFSDIAGLAGADLWDEIIRPGLSVPLFYRTDGNWLFSLIPSLDFAGASGAEIDEAFSYGAVLSAAYAFTPNLTMGLGGGIFERLDQMEIFPYVVVDWQLNDRFSLTNPFRAGPVGPAGLELVYRSKEGLEMGIGGAYRSYRFRLDDSSAIQDGIGQVDFWASFVRMSCPLGRQVHLDLNGGALFSGQITIEDKDANELGDTGYETAPYLGLTLRGRF
jgi:hypothetical protein